MTPDGSPPNADTPGGVASPDGRFVLIGSLASNLVTGIDEGWENGWDVFWHDRYFRRTELVSISAAGRPGGNFSFGGRVTPDGRHVAFSSLAADLVTDESPFGWSLYVRDIEGAVTRRVPVSSGPTPNSDFFEYVVSADGRHVAFTYRATFERDGGIGGVETIDSHPDDVTEVFVHTFD